MVEFDEPVDMIYKEQISKRCSPWGNSCYYITEEQLEELKEGKVIWLDDGEYCNFIALKKYEEVDDEC